ncbi:hypothetical protein [Paracoccus sp. SCSIO 75233]|uniref:hypothetical protein n=1 Tax=Paracoccus sp. SCSIO 75233 TaxID=3017782 RepID=UPI0022EFF9C4|nr:hypothetical protein [Paracoccus sp. SCSIO 75233]WBU53278.1 hypothetical protein PAF12_00080 [Paracoccus sp. SCSIO 75233]
MKYIEVYDYLERASESLIRGDYDETLGHLDAASRLKDQLEPEEAEMAQPCLARLVTLSEAALEGVTDAKKIIEDAIRNSVRLEIYDGVGNRNEIKDRTSPVNRF